jgi:hypothetical protein
VTKKKYYMTNNLIKFSLTLLCACTFFLLSCGGNAATGALDGPEYTSAYICPMHCEGSGSAEMGTCPVCKMDYVANADKAAPEVDPHEGHNHDTHEGHDHGSHEGHNH